MYGLILSAALGAAYLMEDRGWEFLLPVLFVSFTGLVASTLRVRVWVGFVQHLGLWAIILMDYTLDDRIDIRPLIMLVINVFMIILSDAG